MITIFFIFTKKGLAVIFAATIIILTVIGLFSTIKLGAVDGSTNQKRVEYVNSLGLDIDATAVSVKETKIPQKFDGVYSKYNEIQKTAGFNLADFKGQCVTVYTYITTTQPIKTVNLIVQNGRIIAGDICDIKNGSKIYGLMKE